MHAIFDERRYLIPFRSTLLPQIFTDTLVIGSGVAGLRAATAAAQHGDVIVLAKTDAGTSNSAWAQGGIAVVLDEADSTEAHARDTLIAGAGLCDAQAVRSILDAGPDRVNELIGWGMRVDRVGDEVALGREGAHSCNRILHADGDATGRELVRCLLAHVESEPRIRLFDHCFALDLITPNDEPGAPVMGAITYHPRYGLQMVWAGATILASGGAGQVFRETTNPRVATADGLAMAYRAGATLADTAFVQFHPTTLYLAGAERSLVSEAVRGEGAHLLDQGGYRFMPEVHPLAELAPRDVVARAIMERIASQGGTHALLDVRHVDGFATRFPGISGVLDRFDLDPTTDLIPVNPAAHSMIGGVVTDPQGRTDAPGLYAVGEVASTGLHGANRLASNSLLEGLVMGEIAGRACAECRPSESAPNPFGAIDHPAWRSRPPIAPVQVVSDIRPSEHAELDLSDVRSSLRSAMWRNVGIERTGARLADAVDMIDFWARYTLDKIFDDPTGWETQNLLLGAALIARSAHWRDESRGCHWRSDASDTLDRFRVHDEWRRGRAAPDVRAVDTGTPSEVAS